jgi:cytochrome d ubiquinol oxidase subunit I
MTTAQGVSPSVTSTDIWISLMVFVVLYLSLGIADAYLMIHYGRQSFEEESDEDDHGEGEPDSTGGAPSEEPRVPALIY